jgi:hypothetical protein
MSSKTVRINKLLVFLNRVLEFLKIPKLGIARLIRDQRYRTDPDAEMPIHRMPECRC